MLYIITGPAGVGKSTISKKIAESKKKSVLIEGLRRKKAYYYKLL